MAPVSGSKGGSNGGSKPAGTPAKRGATKTAPTKTSAAEQNAASASAAPLADGPDLPEDAVLVLDRADWRRWLQANHRRAQGVWATTYKKHTGLPMPGYDALVEEALCFGWIDSKPRALDAARTMLWFTPRKPGSGWSAPNKLRVERMLAEQRMAPAGLAAVEAAQRDGSWTALDAVEALDIPPDLAAALATFPNATAHFQAFPRSAKRGILEWIAQAKRADTRAKRITETATLAERNLRANQWTPRT